jgi:hypothetical protein
MGASQHIVPNGCLSRDNGSIRSDVDMITTEHPPRLLHSRNPYGDTFAKYYSC